MYTDFVNLDNLITEINNIYSNNPLASNEIIMEPEREVNFYYSTKLNPFCSPQINEMFMISLQRTASGRAQNSKKIDDESIRRDLIQNEIHEKENNIRSQWRSLNSETGDTALRIQNRKATKNRTKVRSSLIRLQIGNLQMLNNNNNNVNNEKPAARHGNQRSNSIRIPEKPPKDISITNPRELASSNSLLVSPTPELSASTDSLLSPIQNDSDDRIAFNAQDNNDPRRSPQRIAIEVPQNQPAAFGKAPIRKLSKSNLNFELAAARTGMQMSHVRKTRASISNEFKAIDVVIPDEKENKLRRIPPAGNRRRPTRPNK
ncbi:hypothetical protein TVAG_071990 [Trichomonas vaginalis G3]|uniref:Uncharacterized protein n=1 Tax=Trichomonas vaginalis (strain ATCC PRA-98 / G3) TaxID=412133 RepID=A2D8A3_TRIV3|nr:hypothetical protein TVAGG3_1047180 [Trichomonas vaginalis G3]EAY23536.1 hypothetical protein TVAG_071990 [Trichomonas vaginalis G3]KAI5493958.1 hypothetical protein TVAGG3_1047180 [Trichomonas vaginalis G3]|eukprot:XP_001584522.1 hypothetical protein [Trichomonas vaginalis G3]